jgi:hypothetical protein
MLREQIRLRNVDFEVALRMLRDVIVEKRERFATLFLFHENRGRASACRHGERRVDQAAIAGQRGLRVAVTLGNVCEIQQCRVGGFIARDELREPALRFSEVTRLQRQQCEAAIDVRLVDFIRAAQALQLIPRFFEPIQGSERLGELECPALRIELRRGTRGGDGVRAVASKDFGSRFNASDAKRSARFVSYA